MLLFAGCKDKSKPKLVMATNAEFPPYEYVTGTKLDGIDPAIIRTIRSQHLHPSACIIQKSFSSVNVLSTNRRLQKHTVFGILNPIKERYQYDFKNKNIYIF